MRHLAFQAAEEAANAAQAAKLAANAAQAAEITRYVAGPASVRPTIIASHRERRLTAPESPA